MGSKTLYNEILHFQTLGTGWHMLTCKVATTTAILRPSVRDFLGEPVPER